MWTSGFFNSVNGDRLYNAQQMSEMFEGLLTGGVFQNVGNKLAVEANTGMTIQVNTGRGYFSKHWVNNDSAYAITIESSDVVLNRWDAIVIKVDDTDSVRNATLEVKKGSSASTPTKPTMERSTFVKEYCLAYVYVGHGATAITQANIEDTRQNTDLCGWVTGLIDQITPDTLYTQFTAQFNEWFQGLVDIIDEDVETTLVGAMTKSLIITLDKDDWVDNTQSITVTGMTPTKTVLIEGVESEYNNNGVKCTSQDTNTLTFTCTTQPTIDVTAKVISSGVYMF